MSAYVPLWCKSNFSFLEGASHPEELVEACATHGIETLALTDRDGVSGSVEAHVKAKETGVRLIHGAEISIDDGSCIVLLATDRAGYANLCRLITKGRLRSEKGTSVVGWREVCEHAAGLLALWGGDRSLLASDIDPFFVAHLLREALDDRLYALATRHRRAEEPAMEARLRTRAARYDIPVIAGSEVLYHKPARRELQDVLTCLRHKVRLTEAGRLTRPNAEHALKSPYAFARLFEDDPSGIERSHEAAARCRFSLDALRYRYPSERLPGGMTSSDWLRRLTHAGAEERYPGKLSQAAHRQIAKELDLIDELDYCGYFLTMWEIVRFCRNEGILCQGRGSAANSVVCYCLGITAVDPVRMGLLFERFLSRERAEPPDIDLDIEHERREEVIQHVYKKYGRDRAAMVANIVRYRARSAARDVGKVLGIAETALSRMSKLLGHSSGLEPAVLAKVGLDAEHPTNRHFLRLATEILDFPRHLSIHPGGFLLGHEPVHDIVPIENATMPDRTVIQWDKDSIEALGLFKVDLLGLGSLRHLHLAFDLLEKHRGLRHGMASIPPADEQTFDMICKGDTVGVFQIESRAQMAMLPRLRPRTYYDLVIEVSIVRPGPIAGGMVHPYLRRRSGLEPVIYPHPCLKPVLEKTLGVPLFQEQVIRLAMVAADYTPGEADQLRRDMAAWRRSGRIERHRERLVRRMTAKGIVQEFAERVFEQIRGFGEYGFPESHAASFALIAYATAWMKRHHHDAFTCGLLNAQPMGFYSPASIIEDARRHGVDVRPLDVERSQWHCTLEPAAEAPPDAAMATMPAIAPAGGDDDSCRRARDGGVITSGGTASQGTLPPIRRRIVDRSLLAVRMGLRYVKGLSETHAERIIAARCEQPFASVEDLVHRTGLDRGRVARLAESGAFSGLDADRRSALWRACGAGEKPALSLQAKETAPGFLPLDLFETISWDYRTTGHSPRGHPLEPLRERLRARHLPDACEVRRMRHGRRVRYAGMVICRQRPGTASGVVFMTLEDEAGHVNVVIWNQVFERHMVLVKTASFIGVTGKLQVQDGVTHLIAETFWDPRQHLDADPASGGSHDFH